MTESMRTLAGFVVGLTVLLGALGLPADPGLVDVLHAPESTRGLSGEGCQGGPANIEGRVVGPDGIGVRNLPIGVWVPGRDGYVEATRTDSLGEYRLSLDAASYVVPLIAKPWNHHRCGHAGSDGPTQIDFTVPRTCVRAIVVRDAAGEPTPATATWGISGWSSPIVNGGWLGRTDCNIGTVAAWGHGHGAAAGILTEDDGTTLVLPPGTPLTGVVRNLIGVPLAQTVISVRTCDGSCTEGPWTVTDEAGRFAIDVARDAASWEVEAVGRLPYQYDGRTLTAVGPLLLGQGLPSLRHEGDLPEMELALERSFRFARCLGRPELRCDLPVTCEPVGRLPWDRRVGISRTGACDMPDVVVRHGDRAVRVSADERFAWFDLSEEPRLGSVTGRVEEGTRVVYAWPLDPAVASFGTFSEEWGFVRRDGTFELSDLPAGHWRLSAEYGRFFQPASSMLSGVVDVWVPETGSVDAGLVPS